MGWTSPHRRSMGLVLGIGLVTACQASTPSPPPLVQDSTPVTVELVRVDANEIPRPPPDAGVVVPSSGPKKKVQWSDFVGAARCGHCHEAIYQKWSRSTHARAGGPPTEARLLPPPKNRRFAFSDARVRLVRQGKTYAFEIESLAAKPRAPSQMVAVDGVVGAEALVGGGAQAYVHRTPQGTVVHLPFEYSHQARKWYCQRRETQGGKVEHTWRPIDGSFPLADCGWPPKSTLGYSNFNHCGNCHGSQIEVAFVAQDHGYRTRWMGLHINCESCHGPGKRHTELMQAPPETHTADIGFAPLDLLDKTQSVGVCLACHATKRVLASSYLSGDSTPAFFSTANMAPHAQRDLHPDGRIADFGYQEGHLFSDCFRNGSMTCVDCHDPHQQSYRDPFGQGLKGRFSDGQCVGCHRAKAVAGTHHGHSAHSKAPGCTDCHMPFHQHPAVPDAFRLTRSDHVIPIPRPGFDDDLGIENACARCHAREGRGWQMSESNRLFGTLKPHPPEVTALKAVRSGRLTPAEWVATLSPAAGPNGVRALTALVVAALDDGLDSVSSATKAKLVKLAASADDDLSAAAITALLVLGEGDPKTRQAALVALGPTPTMARHRRIRRGLLDLYGELAPADQRRGHPIKSALQRYFALTRDEGAALSAALAEAAVKAGALEEAKRYFLEAGATPALTAPTHGFGSGDGAAFQYQVRAGDMAMARRRPQEAIKHFAQAQAMAPRESSGKRGLWMSLLAARRPAEALPVLEDYLRLVPSFTEGHVVRARILDALGRADEARASWETAALHRPNDPQVKAVLERLQSKDSRNR